ncbi:MAG TPA: 23S rRNA (uracil(1939)-C(5))-methyltransferase RlmD [Kofleriaceae bacterium]|nr:23S rRNA (uracil(1939)-C(5))-methyltransferase RlmD [Kofleriaceae bacterium]
MGEVIEATALDPDGCGVGQLGQGGEVRIADLLPGERAEIAIDHRSRHRSVAWGHITRRISPPSAHRCPPACPAFGACGGCVWQHWAYPAQLEGKRDRLQRALDSAGLRVPVAPTVPSPRIIGYRNAAKYVIAGAPGKVILGAFRPRTHEVVSTVGCRVVDPAIDAAATFAKTVLDETPLAIYDEGSRRGHLRYLVIRAGMAADVVLTVVTTPDAPRRTVENLAASSIGRAGITGVAWMKNAATSGRITSADITPLSGTIETREQVAGATLAIAPDAFFQVNRDQALAIYDAIAASLGAGAGTRAVDVFSGAGGIALAVAARGAEVVGIERNANAVAAAQRAADDAGLPARFVCGDAATLATVAERVAPAAVMVNPPRKGLMPATLAALVKVAPARIAYMSCGPESLARDAAALSESGYRLDTVVPYDFLPGTAWVEALAMFEMSRARSI